MRLALIGCACLMLAACVNGYERFYTPLPQGAVAVERFAGEPSVIESTGNPSADVDAMFARGFGPIGSASFNGPIQNIENAIAEGKKVGAEYIVVSRQYARTVSGVIPMTTFSPQTTYTSGTVNAYGSGGYASGTYSGTSTTYNQQTAYVPYSVERYDQRAIFFAPLGREGVGLRVVELSPKDAQRLGTQKGVIVTAVRRGSPAFDADILPGDLLTLVGGHAVYDQETAAAQFRAAYGSDVVMTLLREDKVIEKIVHLPVGGVWN